MSVRHFSITQDPAVPMGEVMRQTHLTTSRCDAMEKSRRYIDRHQSTAITNIYTDDKRIHPIWPKVTSTPFSTRAALSKGYGREVDDPPRRSYVSRDKPSSFFDPEKVRQPSNRMDEKTACVTRIPKTNQRETAMHVLPGAMAIGHVLEHKKPHAKHRAYKHGKRTLIDVLVTERDNREPIQWGPIHPPAIHDE
jgi:hypothetical protein